MGGIAHAFNGSPQQARAFIELGFKLGFGGAMNLTSAPCNSPPGGRAPAEALVLETDAPDIPPHWLDTTVAERAAGPAPGAQHPAGCPRIAQVVADSRGGMAVADLARGHHRQRLRRLAGVAEVIASKWPVALIYQALAAIDFIVEAP